jgi:hypothetical protein
MRGQPDAHGLAKCQPPSGQPAEGDNDVHWDFHCEVVAWAPFIRASVCASGRRSAPLL